ncbi:MAG: nitronate monooxygenase [bacterium]
MNPTIPKLKIGNFEATIPIIQGGMSIGISLSGLASAVANEGGIGVIGSAGIGMLEPDFVKNVSAANKRALQNEIRNAKKLTKGIIGVNILVALSDCDELVLAAIDENVDLIFLGAGLPLKNPKNMPPDRLTKALAKIIPIVSSARSAHIIFQYWAEHYKSVPNAVVVEGPLAGGHLGFKRENIDNPTYALEQLVPEVVSAIKPFEKQFNKNIPVVAAGGIYTGTDIYKIMKLGADGVQMATRFVATHECDASLAFRQKYLKCEKKDIGIIDSPVGLPGRAIINQFLENVSKKMNNPLVCPWKCLRTCNFRKAPYCIALALTKAKLGNNKEGFCFAGANAYRVDKIISVKELIDSLLAEYKKASSLSPA